MRTSFSNLLEIEYPVVQAPIGTGTVPALVAAVSNAGGLGMFAFSWRSPASVRDCLKDVRELTARPFGVNLCLDEQVLSRRDLMERLELSLQGGARLVSLFWHRHPDKFRDLIGRIHQAGAYVAFTVGSSDEALRAMDVEADILVAQGIEAGGHVWGEKPLFALLDDLAAVAGDIPLLAAGGLANGRDLGRALQVGAAGGWFGTRFLASVEAGFHPAYKQAVLDTQPGDTVRTLVFDGGWPNAWHRVRRTRRVSDWIAAGEPEAGSRPDEGLVIGRYREEPLYLYDEMPPIVDDFELLTDVENFPLYMGESAGKIGEVLPAGEIVLQLVKEAEKASMKQAARDNWTA